MAEKKKSAAKVSPKKNNATIKEGATMPREDIFPIIGIGASAGGLAAFEAFFSAMPADRDTDMAYVLVQHLAPDHKSILSELIGRYTRMQVFEVTDGMKVEPNCAYIIPPNHDMAFLNGNLHLLEPSAPRGQRLPIDYLFRSLAQNLRERAICIILSGTGSDGTLGVRAIKGEGGMVMAQTPESTEYDGMPRSAIATGIVDYVLPPAEMPAQLIAYAAHAYGKTKRPVSEPAPKEADDLKKIFILLLSQTGHDFSGYKQNTISRRVERRMAVHQIDHLNDYIRFLQQTPTEVDALFRDLLIGVTRFFRDPDAFVALQEQILPHLFAGRSTGATLRIWVPGCSTGEEAYSIAMLLKEQIDEAKNSFKLQIFATDIDDQAIEQARSGIYPASIAIDVSQERIARFFTQEPGSNDYRIHKSIRDMIVFSAQDVIKDPPFSKLDIISCRNLLIYINGELQRKLIPLFHYSLNPGGLLFLGSSETIGEFGNLFTALDRKSKLYLRKDDPAGPHHQPFYRLAAPMTDKRGTLHPSLNAPAESKLQLRELTERALLQQYARAGALVNERGDILYIHGRTGQYLEPAQGESGMNILKMARDGLRRDLTTALHKAVTTNETVNHTDLQVKTNGDYTSVNLTVRPVTHALNQASEQDLFLVILEEAPAKQDIPAPAATEPHAGACEGDKKMDARIAALKKELHAKEEFLQTTNEELETSNEELKSSNEEMQSVNEELQSTNEELETSKEELQSVNEELATVNSELQIKVTDLSQVNNDMNNFLSGTGVGIIFVDHQLRIRRFTPSITQVINLISTDVGRSVVHVVSNLTGYDRLESDVHEVLDTLTPKEIEVQTKAGMWYLLKIRPYRTLENVIEGAVITFTEITELKKALAKIRESEGLRRLAVVVRESHDAILVQDFDGRILTWNPGAARMYGWSEEEALTMNISDLIPEDKRKESLSVVRKLIKAKVLEPYQTERVAKDGRVLNVSLTATALVNDSGKAYAIATTERENNAEKEKEK